MPEVSYDGRSFSIDGRRVWLVSGSVPYARTPRGLWHSRVRAAKQAGLNCVETPVFWSAHEREPGVFDFTDELDLRAFVQIVADEGLYCILRPGPYVGSGWDMGGLPGYLHGVADKKGILARVREDEPQFMHAVDRYMRALMKQVGDLQVSSSVDSASSISGVHPAGSAAGGYSGEGGGPIVLMQVEHAWHSHQPIGEPYLTRLVSLMRQRGVGVPIINANNLWQPVDGTIDTWTGERDLPAIMRQLAMIQPEAPAMVIELGPDQSDPHRDTTAQPINAATHAYRLSGMVGVGAQFNLSPFDAGTNLGFTGGRASDADVPFMSPGPNRGTLLNEAGQRGPLFHATKRVCTFASQFGYVLASREPNAAPTVALSEHNHPTAVLHQRSNQGTVITLIKSEKDKSKHTELMLPTGLTLDVPHAGQRAAWVLLDTNLGGVCTLDYTSLSPWAFVDRKLLIVFGPANAQGVVAIDGQHHDITVPSGKSPTVIDSDPVHIAVLNHDQIDAACLGPDGLVIGCDGLDNDDKPLPLAGWGTQFLITTEGQVSKKRINPLRKPDAPTLGKWQTLSLKPLVEGTDKHYRAIDGPAALGTLGQGFGYGWYRFTQPKPISGKIIAPKGGDRLHLYQKGKLSTILGTGEGASSDPTQLKLAGNVIALADNLGRISAGQEGGQDVKGLADHLYTVKPIKPGKPQSIKQPAGDPFTVTKLAHNQRAGVRTMSEAIAWQIKPESRKPILLEVTDLPQPAVVSVNDVPIRFIDASATGCRVRLLLDPAEMEAMTGGKNTIKLELLTPLATGVKIDSHIRFFQTTGLATPKEGWAFTPWTIPATDRVDWRDLPKSLPSQPAWVRCNFSISATDTPPLWLEPHGMSKGQVVLNGHNLGRYWNQTREGKLVGPNERCYLPEPWLNTDAPNELMLFDEHGRTPEKCKLVYGD